MAVAVRMSPFAANIVGDRTAPASRLSVTAPDVPPPERPVPALTAVMSPVEVKTCQEDVPPFQTYIL